MTQRFWSTAPESSHQVFTGEGDLLSVTCLTGTQNGMIVAIDSVTVPHAGPISPLWFMLVDSNTANGYGFREFRYPIQVRAGCVLLFTISASPLIYTPPDAANGAGLVYFAGQYS